MYMQLDDQHEAFSVHLHNAMVGWLSNPFKDLFIAGLALVAMIPTYNLIGARKLEKNLYSVFVHEWTLNLMLTHQVSVIYVSSK